MVENKINIIPYGGKPLETTNGYLSNSPDLNPIKNAFGYWDSQVKKHEPQNIDDLIKFIKEEWENIPQSMIRNCIQRLSKVMKWVHKYNGEFYNV